MRRFILFAYHKEEKVADIRKRKNIKDKGMGREKEREKLWNIQILKRDHVLKITLFNVGELLVIVLCDISCASFTPLFLMKD